MSLAVELDKLKKLHDDGTITDEQYERAKARLLEDPLPVADELPDEPQRVDPRADDRQETRQWSMMLHLSQLANAVVPPAGIVLPILIWQMKKDVLPQLDAHGKEAVNWIISSTIYLAVGAVLSLVLVGLPILLAAIAASIAFPIVAGVKASNGELWRYPCNIRFIK